MSTKKLQPQANANKRKRRAKKQRAKKVPRTNHAQSPRAHRRSAPTVALSPCAMDYAAALRNPFTGPLACVPSSFPPLPSGKLRTWCKGTTVVGSGKTGFVLVDPFMMPTSSTGSIATSTSAYAATTFPGSMTGAGIANPITNSTYTTGSFNPDLQYRLVSCGIRVWYIDSEQTINGSMVGLHTPDNTSLYSKAESDLLAYPSALRVAVDSTRSPINVLWSPSRPGELEFQSSTATNSVACLGVMITAAAAQLFAFEAACTFEVIGANATVRSPSHADPAGFAAVLEANAAVGDTWYGSAYDSAKSVVTSAFNVLGHLSGTRVGQAVQGAAINYVGHRFNSRFGPGPSARPQGGVSVSELDYPDPNGGEDAQSQMGDRHTGQNAVVYSPQDCERSGHQTIAVPVEDTHLPVAPSALPHPEQAPPEPSTGETVVNLPNGSWRWFKR